jgi:aminoglycoside phosphotransferase (APT) family kinase protein
MVREHRVITAVGATSVPVAPTLAVCVDESINGSPFYVMGFVDGVVLDSAERAAPLAVDQRRSASNDLIEVLARLHDVDVDAVGLGDLARRDGYIARQLKRWSTQWSNSKQRELPAIDEVERRLRAGVPEQIGVSIVHGDFRFGNLLVDPAAGLVNAVLDWELCSLGDPLADLGWLLVYWSDPGESRQFNDPTAAGGFLTRSEVVEAYARASGRDVSHAGFYEAFGLWRLACISEGVYARYRHGVMGGDEVDLDQFRQGTERLAEAALMACQSFA